jgi:teichuronic acid exporter
MLRTAAGGMVWTTSSTVVRSLVGLFQISILTRYLAMGDFGTIAIATVFIGFTQIFLDLGISAGIMHKQDATKDQLSSLFWLNLFTGFILTLVLIAGSPLVSMVYDDESLTRIIMLLSLSVFLASLGSQHRTIQQKEMRFRYMAIIEMASSLLAMAVAVTLALNGYGVYSLVYSTLTGVAVSNLLFLTLGLRKDKNIYLHFRLKDTYPFLKIGVFSIGSRVLDYFSREIDIIFIGASFGKDVLGLYTLCKKIVQMLYGIINPIITRILTPLFAKIQTDRNKIKGVYFKLIETLAITNLPIYFMVSIFSKTILFYLYGEQYVAGAFILSILAIYYGLLSISNPVGSLQIALGRTDIGFYWTIYRVLSTLVVVYLASFYNIETLVLFFLLLSVVNTFAMWRFQLFIMIKMSLKEFLAALLKPLAAILIISIPFYLILWTKTSLVYSILGSLTILIIYSLIAFKFFSKSYIISLVNTGYIHFFNSNKI